MGGIKNPLFGRYDRGDHFTKVIRLLGFIAVVRFLMIAIAAA